MTLNPIDQDALARSLAACRLESPGRAAQLDSMLIDRPWERVAQFASYSCQIDALGLMPWQQPPCKIHLDSAIHEPFGDPSGRREAGEVLQRLLRNGLSKFEPDPLGAIAEAEQRRMAAK